VSRIGGEFTIAETGITREDLSGLAVDMLNAHRSHSGSNATRDLIETANTITTLFPPVDRLLVVPCGCRFADPLVRLLRTLRSTARGDHHDHRRTNSGMGKHQATIGR
jgi:hypothetical protein